ncbi:MAG: hypothetical protein M1817_001130 [Caeruleum heppii]|nr:MAG: hypothetical protein M1817_001130 [Caeruleum heppii]
MSTSFEIVDNTPHPREIKHEQNRRRLRWARIGLSVVTVAIGLTVLGTAAQGKRIFADSILPDSFNLPPLWPTDLDLRGTNAVMSAGGLIAMMYLGFLCLNAILMCCHFFTFENYLFAIVASISLVLSVIAVSLSEATDKSATAPTIRNWSCNLRNVVSTGAADFGKACSVTKASQDVAIVLLVLQVCTTAVAALGFWRESLMKKWRISVRHSKWAGTPDSPQP